MTMEGIGGDSQSAPGVWDEELVDRDVDTALCDNCDSTPSNRVRCEIMPVMRETGDAEEGVAGFHIV
jgi:hypothetical protein